MVTNIKISRFWSRLAAFTIDLTILGILGFILGLIFEGFLTRIGTYGYLFGLMICAVYFTIFNSGLFKGQTVGKLALMIQVVDKDGNTLSIGRSLYRALILCGPYFIVSVNIPGIYTGSFLYILKDIILISLSLGVVVIYIFNKGNRQSLHDIFAGTFVVAKKRVEEIVPEIHQKISSEMHEGNSTATREETTTQALPEIIPEIRNGNTSFPTITKYSWYFFGGFVILLIAINLFFFIDKNSGLGTTNTVYNKVSNIDGVVKADITKSTMKSFGKDHSVTRSYSARLWVTDFPNDIADLENNVLVQESVRIILNNEPEIDNFDIISVSLIKGFNIGIAKKSTSYNVRKAPAGWKKLLTDKTIYN